jgi:hypothetical protein
MVTGEPSAKPPGEMITTSPAGFARTDIARFVLADSPAYQDS